jgi:hypothetical protein
VESFAITRAMAVHAARLFAAIRLERVVHVFRHDHRRNAPRRPGSTGSSQPVKGRNWKNWKKKKN